MNRSNTFNRKVIYFVLIAVLLLPLSFLSRPRSRTRDGEIREGGLLSQMRTEYKLSQAQLGQIDPTSESVKLATLGLRGIAAHLLWNRADYYKKVEDWDNLTATLEQMIKLQPNYVSVWKFQAWNLSYNVSVEFDDYRQRYHWVKKGIGFLLDGMDYNEDEPRLLWDTGWFFGHKIGRSDEKFQYRRMFKTDEDFHKVLRPELGKDAEGRDRMNRTLGPQQTRPDSWKVSHAWFKKAQDVVDTKDKPLLGQSPLIFHSDPAMSLIRYAEAIEMEGFHGEVGQQAWKVAGETFFDYGQRDIPSSWGYDIRLNDEQKAAERAEKLRTEFEEFLLGLREELIAKKVAARSPEEQKAYHTPVDDRTDEQHTLMQTIKWELEVSNAEVAEASPEDKKLEAKRLAFALSEAQDFATTIRRYRQIVNFDYWETKCEVEQTAIAVEARKQIYDANALQKSALYERARVIYEKAWENFAKIFEDYPTLMDDVKSDDIMDAIKRYALLVEAMEEDFPPPDFPLVEFVRLHEPRMVAKDQSVPTSDSNSNGAEIDDKSEDSSANGNGESDATEDQGSQVTDDQEPADSAESTETESTETL